MGSGSFITEPQAGALPGPGSRTGPAASCEETPAARALGPWPRGVSGQGFSVPAAVRCLPCGPGRAGGRRECGGAGSGGQRRQRAAARPAPPRLPGSPRPWRCPRGSSRGRRRGRSCGQRQLAVPGPAAAAPPRPAAAGAAGPGGSGAAERGGPAAPGTPWSPAGRGAAGAAGSGEGHEALALPRCGSELCPLSLLLEPFASSP